MVYINIKLHHYQKYGTSWLKLCKLKFHMATKSDYEIYRRRQNIKFSPTLCKYFTVADFDISCGIHEQYFYTNIGRISPRLGGSREGCTIFYVFVVLHNIIHRNRPTSFWFMQTAELEVNLAMFINCYISYKNYRQTPRQTGFNFV